MSLENYRKGYAVMTADLEGIKIDGEYLDELKQWCRNDDVIAERIPYVRGYSITIKILSDFYKLFCFKKYSSFKNILWIHWKTSKEYAHKTGKIVWSNINNEKEKAK